MLGPLVVDGSSEICGRLCRECSSKLFEFRTSFCRNLIGPKTGSNRAQNTAQLLGDLFGCSWFLNVFVRFVGG